MFNSIHQRAPSELSSHQKKILHIDAHVGVSIAGLTADARFLRYCYYKYRKLYNMVWWPQGHTFQTYGRNAYGCLFQWRTRILAIKNCWFCIKFYMFTLNILNVLLLEDIFFTPHWHIFVFLHWLFWPTKIISLFPITLNFKIG